uniref:ANK_REP_REGION domain-containing protein n=1 Tax=Haemonchus placei TaxID=6290 RepID=A0A158QPS6_HAEPC
LSTKRSSILSIIIYFHEWFQLFTFTVPTLPFTQDRSVQLTLRSQALHISIPFTYRTSSSTSRFECLAEFAATGEISSLIVPFAGHIGERDGEGNTVLHISAKNSQSFALKLLLSAPLPRVTNGVLITALHCAVRAGDPDSVHYLLSHGSGTRVLDNHKNSVTNLVIHYLADAYNEAIFKEILETPGSSENELDALNEEGFSALHLAVRRLKLSLIELLLEAGASINAKDSAGRSPLFHAVNMNDVEIVQFLLGKGADPNVEDDSGETPLLLCMKTANYAIMGLLIDAGADPNRKNRNGNSLSDSDDATVQRIIAGERRSITDDISCLDYLTRLRLSKLMDENSKWQQLAAELGCSHMIELISICSDDSSPTMILLDQFEQMPEAKISRVRSALHTLREEESVKLIDDRFIY